MKQLFIDRLIDFFKTVQRNKYGALIGTLILVIIVQFAAIYYMAKDRVKMEGTRDKERLTLQKDKDSVILLYQTFLERQISELRSINQMLDSANASTNNKLPK